MQIRPCDFRPVAISGQLINFYMTELYLFDVTLSKVSISCMIHTMNTFVCNQPLPLTWKLILKFLRQDGNECDRTEKQCDRTERRKQIQLIVNLNPSLD